MKPILLLCWSTLLCPSKAASDAPSLDRMLALAKVWATVEYFHPYAGFRKAGWEDAVVNAVPAIKAAGNKRELATAFSRLLGVIEDPVTRVVEASSPVRQEVSDAGIAVRSTKDGILILTIVGPTSSAEIDKHIDALSAARTLVVDLRRGGGPAFGAAKLSHMIFTKNVVAPAQRRRTAGYDGGMLVEGGRLFSPGLRARDIPTIFVAGPKTALPPIALALQAVGQGRIVCEGAPAEDTLVTAERIRLPEGVEVQIRVTELLNADGSTGFTADAVVSRDALEAALELARQPARPRVTPPLAPPVVVPNRLEWLDVRSEPERPSGSDYPAPGNRLLAGFRVWSVFQILDAYRARSRDEWDAILKKFMPRLEAAGNATEYHVAVAEMIGCARDSHAFASSPVLRRYIGEAQTAVAIRPIEGKLVISLVLASNTGLEPGDTVTKIDGKDALGILQQRIQRFPGSAPHGSALHAAGTLLSGPAGSHVSVVAEGRDGRIKTATLTRSSTVNPYYPGRRGDVMRVLPGNVGYVDLERLPEARVDEMFENFKNTRAIVFDIRGYPRFTAWAIAARLTDEPLKRAWRRTYPLAVYPDAFTRSSDWVMERDVVQSNFLGLKKSGKWRYGGRTIALIDERAMSSPEMSAILLKTANGSVLVGSRTVGATGIRTIFSLPGGITGSYSSSLIGFADGPATQGRGVPPDVEVKPTIAGIRDGRDEVLEAALQHLGVTERVHGVGEAR